MDLPEHVHTNRELELMLAGTKPLAVFGDDISCLPDELIIPEKGFASYVATGRFFRVEKTVEGSYSENLGRNVIIKNVLFCLPDEKWRIPAMLLLKEQSYKTGRWNETCERMEGALLGYTDEENDIWCSSRFTD